MTPLKLPSHWNTVRLGDICDVRYGLGQPPELAADGIPMIRATDIKNGKIVSEAVLRVRPDAIPTGKKPFLKTGDILVVRSGAYTGDVAMYDGRWPSAIAGYDLIADPAPDRVDSAYLTACLLSEAVQRYFRSQRDRSAQPHLNSDQLKNTTIPLPSLPEQRAIARALRAVQQAKESRRREAALERERKAALMEHLLTHGTRPRRVAPQTTRFGSLPHDWKILPLEQCAFVQTGVAVGRRLGDAPTVTRPYLRVANVQNGFLDLAEMKEITIRASEVQRYALRDGDVVLTEGGDFDKLGRGFIWRGQVPNCVHQNHIFAVRADRSVLLPEFLTYLVQSEYGRVYFLSVAHKTTNLACINTAKLKAFPAALPGLEEQQEIVRALDACDAKIAAVEQEAALLDELFRALLEELMTGRVRVKDLAVLAEAAPGEKKTSATQEVFSKLE